MIKYQLVALFVAMGEPQSYILDYGLTIEDCGQAIVRVHNSNERIRLPALTTFACEPETTESNFREALK